MSAPLLSVVDLKKHFPIRAGLLGRVQEWVRAVDGVSFDLALGETLGLVGESGCGKTTVGRTLLRLTPATGGQVVFGGQDLLALSGGALRQARRRMQLIFQDPYGSLNPRMTIEQIVGEPLGVHRLARGSERQDRIATLLKQVGLRPEAAGRYPHEFSGGQRQRIGIARALALEPSFIVCDEPTSALDVSIRAQIVNLLQDLQRERGLSYLMISHDLGVVRHISTAVAVMYLGRIVEQAPTEALYDQPRHPYTRLLLAAIPIPDPRQRGRRIQAAANAAGDDAVPSPINLPPGCPFHPRCPLYQQLGRPESCRNQVPEFVPLESNPRHVVRCHFPHETETVAAGPRVAATS
jgi:oligopeptide/dipeptide ABC transporter ATP-binding protein